MTETTPDWSWVDAQITPSGWAKCLHRSSPAPGYVCWENGAAHIYRYQPDGLFAAADGGGWHDGLFDSFEEAMRHVQP